MAGWRESCRIRGGGRTVRPMLLVAALLASPVATAADPATARRPNILFVVVDDQTPTELRCYDPRSRLETPTIDRLAREGMVLDAAYHMGSFSGAVCVPSRHMLMCGRTLWHLPIGPGARRRGPPANDAGPARCPDDIERFTLPAVFAAAGYDTMRTCKEGNGYEGADRLFAVRHDATKREGTHEGGSGWHADRVLDYLAERERSADRDPFLIYLGFSHPHDTRDGTPDLLAKYGAVNHADAAARPLLDPRQPPLPAAWLPGHPFDHGDLQVRDEVAVSGVWRNRDEATIRNETGREFACAENIDRQLGRVLDRLAALGELDRTWIVYTADHGMALGRHGLQGKQNLYEHTWRVPLVVRGPGVPAGSRAAGNVYLLDVLATLCDIAAIPVPDSNEGRSFLPVLEGRTTAIREVLYGAYCGGGKPGIRSLRRGDWKLVKYESPSGGLHTQLFDLRGNPEELLPEHRDPAGRTNLADAPAQAAIRRELEGLLLAEMERLHDPFRFSDQPVREPAVP